MLGLAVPALQARVWHSTPRTGLGAVVARSAAGDTVRIAAGTYHEDSVRVAHPLVLIAEPGAVLDAKGGGHALWITADGCTVQGLEFRNASLSHRTDFAAILAEDVAGLVVRDCTFRRNFFGIYLARCRDALVTGNRIDAVSGSETRSGNGIHLWHCRDTRITGNRVSGHRDGIYLEFTRRTTIANNVGSGNLRYGLHFMFSDSCHYLENTFSRNGAGVAVMYSRHVDMSRNRFTDNWGPAAYGVLLKEISDSRLDGNVFRGNTCGLYVEASNRLHATGNRFERNGWALRLMANSTEGLYEDNVFSANGFDVATQGLQNYSRFVGNFWDRHRGYDLDHDGFGDVPFRPVSVFSLVVQDQGPALILLRSLIVDLLDLAERAFPMLTPPTLLDEKPRMEART